EVERVWATFSGRSHVPVRTKGWLGRLRKAALLSQSNPEVSRALEELARTRPLLARLGKVLLDRGPGAPARDDPIVADSWGLWARAVPQLNCPWAEPLGSPARLARSRRELEEATDSHLKAIGQEFDLRALWAALGNEGLAWDNTDLVFQVGGPLLAAPLA